jgi:hypothetical protein
MHPDFQDKLALTSREGSDRDRLHALARVVVEYNASDAEAIAEIRSIFDGCPPQFPVSDYDITAAIREAETWVFRGSAFRLSNFLTTKFGDKPKREPLSLANIKEELHKITDGWPRRVGNVLFVDDGHIHWFDRRTASGLFGWLKNKSVVEWHRGSNYLEKAELFAELERTAQRYDGIELLPHEPPFPNIYYRGDAPPPGDGSHLGWLVNRFRPETTIDRDLIKSMFMTTASGIPPGRRPAYTVTSDDGRGTGKTTLPEMLAHLFGGFIDVSANEDIGVIKQRILSPEGQTKRIVLLDNVKSLRFSWAELEALITAPVISGKQMYVGEAQRPNLLTWFITLNGVSMATDMALRSIIIKLVKGENAGPWYEETINYIDAHRREIIGDIIAALRVPPKPLAKFSRWATWEQHVLSRLPDPEAAQRLILERQSEANCELDDAEIIEQHFAEQLEAYSFDPLTAQVRIPVGMAAEWLSAAVRDRVSTTAASRRLNQMAKEGHLKRITPDPGRSHGRCFIWTGKAANVTGDRIDNTLLVRPPSELSNLSR